MTAAPDPKPKKVVNRSPEYPAMDLESAIAKAEIVRSKEGFAYTAVSVAAGHWNYSPGSGSGLRAIAALRHYGLLEEDGSGPARRVRLTTLAKNILLDNREGSAEKATAIRQAALNPKIYRTLWALWGPSLPSNENMQYHLQAKLDFNAGAISGFIKDFRATVGFAKLAQGGDIDGATGEVDGEKEKKDTPPPGTPLKPKETPMASVGQDAQPFDLPVPLIGGGTATLRMPRPISGEDYDHMVALLNANLTALRKALVRDPVAQKPDVES
jgi:hypothetical protein